MIYEHYPVMIYKNQLVETKKQGDGLFTVIDVLGRKKVDVHYCKLKLLPPYK
jgi:hypothetical protein